MSDPLMPPVDAGEQSESWKRDPAGRLPTGDLEVNEADAQEQAQPFDPLDADPPEPAVGASDAAEADALEQAEPVPLDEEGYR